MLCYKNSEKSVYNLAVIEYQGSPCRNLHKGDMQRAKSAGLSHALSHCESVRSERRETGLEEAASVTGQFGGIKADSEMHKVHVP